jgi:3-carboxy-cis,cis-muconate cycloisomerase
VAQFLRRVRDPADQVEEHGLFLLAGEPGLAGVDLAALTDPARYTGSAGALTDRALERR